MGHDDTQRDIRDEEHARVLSSPTRNATATRSFLVHRQTTATTDKLKASGIAEITGEPRDFHRSRKKRDDSFPLGRSNIIFINSGATLFHCNTFSRGYPPIRFVIPLRTGRRRFEQVEGYFASDVPISSSKRMDNARFRSAWRNYPGGVSCRPNRRSINSRWESIDSTNESTSRLTFRFGGGCGSCGSYIDRTWQG